MALSPKHPADQSSNPDQPGTPPQDVSKPVGDALPTPVEPGLDQPLPEKGESEVEPVGLPTARGIARDGIADQADASDPDRDDRTGLPGKGTSDFA